jgi:acetyl-CoA C-acetyltransferase
MSKREVYVIGYGITKFGEHYELNPSSGASQALSKAIQDAKISKDLIQSLYFGSLVSNRNGQSYIGAEASRECNLNIPITKIDVGNASGAGAFHQAFIAIKSGLLDCIAVLGSEKLSDFVNSSTLEKILGGTIDYQWEFEQGATLTSLYAWMTQAHMKEFNTTMEQLASVPVKNHKNGVNNPIAQFRREISVKRFLDAKRISDPIGRFDPATHCDGSAAVVIASKEFVESYSEIEKKVKVVGSAQSSDKISLHHRETLSSLLATQIASKKAYEMAQISSKDISIAEVHDSYPIGEILAIEDLGFFQKGDGGKATIEGKTQLNSDISVNTSGGLKARGDPFGATGIAQIIEIIQQMRREADKRQVDDIKYGLAQNVMGTGASVLVHILSNMEDDK